ncbi:MAG TPA: hypothetical protein VFL60_08335 [Gaiellaceae bacterium]|nr:hypothetical protein [Gaiellaceae bacterium]
MGSVLAAVAVVAAVFQHAAASQRQPQTLVPAQPGTIAAFAQDGPVIAWFTPRGAGCNTVQVRSLKSGLELTLPDQTARNVTCRFVRNPHVSVGLAVAADPGRIAWTLPLASPLQLNYLLGAGVEPKEQVERRYHELAHTARGVGQWLGGIAGDAGTLAYATTTVDFADEAGCLAGTSPCTLIKAGGGVYRLGGRVPVVHVPHTGPAVSVAVSGNAIAYVPTGGLGKDGRPHASADMPIEVVDARTGARIARVLPRGVPLALAISPHLLAALERTPLGLRLAWYDRATGRPAGSLPVPGTTSPTLSATDRLIVFRVGRSIRGVDVATRRARLLARAAATPVGLSVDGDRVAWAENLKGSARVRALYVSGSG